MESLALAMGMFTTFLLLTMSMVGNDVMLLFPLAVAMSTSFVCTTAKPEQWVRMALCVAGPTVVMSLLFVVGGNWKTGEDLHWLLVALIALVVCGVPAWVAQRVSSKQ